MNLTLQVVSLRDLATQSYGQPMMVGHVAEAVRSFSDECKNPESMLYKHAGDYELYLVGSFDRQTGLLAALEPERLARAADFVTKN